MLSLLLYFRYLGCLPRSDGFNHLQVSCGTADLTLYYYNNMIFQNLNPFLF